jgi:hypothetical protein
VRPEQRTHGQLVEANDRHQDLTHGTTILAKSCSNGCSDWHEGHRGRRVVQHRALQL